MPVYQDDLDNIIGVLYAKDLLNYVGQAQPPSLRAIMRKAFFVPETKPLDDLLRQFRARKVHMAVVLDEYGGTVLAGAGGTEVFAEHCAGCHGSDARGSGQIGAGSAAGDWRANQQPRCGR